MTPELSLILSTAEIRICLNVLRCEQWDDLPLIDTGEPAEQRLMNAFLHLIQTGRFLPVEGGYQMEPAFCYQMLCIGQADAVYHLYEKERILAFLYEKDQQIAALSPDWGNRECCRVSFFHNASLADVQAWFSSLSEPAADLELRKPETEGSGHDQYDVEKLAFFLGTATNTEEAQ